MESWNSWALWVSNCSRANIYEASVAIGFFVGGICGGF